MSRFKNSSGTRITKGLFFETADSKDNVIYTLKREDHQGFVSLYRLYMDYRDPAEHRFATDNLDGWEHWEILCDCTWFKPFVAVWRRELAAMLESDALSVVEKLKRSENESTAMKAATYLLERARKPAGEFKRGRPTKVAVQAEIERMASVEANLANDYARVTGKIN